MRIWVAETGFLTVIIHQNNEKENLNEGHVEEFNLKRPMLKVEERYPGREAGLASSLVSLRPKFQI